MAKNESFDRVLTTLDEKQRVIILSEMGRTTPDAGIFDEPTRCFKFNTEWCKTVVGWMTWMTDIAFWKDAQDESYSAIRQMLIALEGEPCLPPVLPQAGCIAYPTYHSSIRYLPSNPYTDPDLVPDGYSFPPFDVYRGGDIFPVNDLYDITVRLSSYPIEYDWTGATFGTMPEIIITVSGIGEIELKFQNRPFGGRVGITIDRRFNIVDLIIDGLIDTGAIILELEQDVSSFPGESVAVISKEIQFDTDTIHEIHIMFLPVFDFDITPIKFGGVFKGYTLCGLTPVAQGENIVNDVRLNGCDLEKLVNGIWVNAGNILTCVQPSIDSLQGQITSNDGDIFALQNVNTTQSNDIIALYAENDIQDIDIATNALDIANLQIDAAQQALTLNDHETRITNEELATTSLNNEINDLWTESNSQHTRITTLENAPSGGGGGGILTTNYVEVISASFLTASGTPVAVPETLINHQFTYGKALIMASLQMQHSPNVGECLAIIEVNGINGVKEASVYSNNVAETIVVAETFDSLDTSSPVTIQVKAASINGAYTRVASQQTVVWTIVEYADSALSSIVNFDSNSYPYVFTPANNGGLVTVGGNPDNCLAVEYNDYAEIEIDMGAVLDAGSIHADLWGSDNGEVYIWVYVDDVLRLAGSRVANVGAWTSQVELISDLVVSIGQIVRIGMSTGSGATQARIDNITIQALQA